MNSCLRASIFAANSTARSAFPRMIQGKAIGDSTNNLSTTATDMRDHPALYPETIFQELLQLKWQAETS